LRAVVVAAAGDVVEGWVAVVEEGMVVVVVEGFDRFGERHILRTVVAVQALKPKHYE
jgi:hypothetical protein